MKSDFYDEYEMNKNETGHLSAQVPAIHCHSHHRCPNINKQYKMKLSNQSVNADARLLKMEHFQTVSWCTGESTNLVKDSRLTLEG